MKLIISNIDSYKWNFSNNKLNPIFPNKETMFKIKKLFELLKNNYKNILESDEEHKYILYFRASKGKYTDDETYKYYFKNEEFDEAENIKRDWDYNYPNRYKWFSLVFCHSYYRNVNYYSFYIDNRNIFSFSDEKIDSYNNYSYIFKTVFKMVNEHIKLSNSGKFKTMFEKTFGFGKRRGIIEYKKVWEFYPSLKRKYLYQLRNIDLKKVFEEASKDDITYFDKMSSGKYFDICKIGYLAVDKTIDEQIDSKTLFYEKADGRTFGLENINLSSEDEFDEWFKEYGEHPDHCFEIFPGRSFYRGDLRIKKNEKGYYLTLSGNNYHTEIDVLKFYYSLLEKGIKVKLINRDLLKSRIDGTAVFAIESEDNWCYGYTTVFGESYIDSIHIADFPKLIPAVHWEEIPMSKFIGN